MLDLRGRGIALPGSYPKKKKCTRPSELLESQPEGPCLSLSSVLQPWLPRREGWSAPVPLSPHGPPTMRKTGGVQRFGAIPPNSTYCHLQGGSRPRPLLQTGDALCFILLSIVFVCSVRISRYVVSTHRHLSLCCYFTLFFAS